MITPTVLAAGVAALAPHVVAQNNPNSDYQTQSQPDLTSQCLETIGLNFPDCVNGPLAANLVCNATAAPGARASALMSALTLDELISITGNTDYAVPRLGLPPYQVWNEALHGLCRANFSETGDFSWATSFPMPILTMASMNRTLVNQIADQIGTQARAYNNFGKYGLDSYAPNINGFRSPVWGRGQETPGEDGHFLSAVYAYEYITGLQGGVNPENLKVVATPKHFAGYDLENTQNVSRLYNDPSITQQDLAEYYTPMFVSAIQYAKARSLMCSYNAVNGVPSCANSFFMETLARDTWGFDEDAGYISTDCGANYGVFNPHRFAANESQAAAYGIRAGADVNCGTNYQYFLNESVAEGLVSRSEIERAVGRLYTQLITAGYFDGPTSAYRDLTFADVMSTDAMNVSYEAAVAGLTLLKNDGTLPLSDKVKSIALIGPWANATVQLQGNYFGPAPYLTSPLAAAQASGLTVNYAFGTNISDMSTGGFAEALSAAQNSDAIVFAGGIDNTVEAEGQDRLNITWPGNQLDLIAQLSKVGKPLVVLQMGGGQIDSSSLKNNKDVNSLMWGGYPGQSGGSAIIDVLTGKRAPAGRLVTTQYPASYVTDFSQLDPNLRPNAATGNPGQTYMWYTGKPVYAFGDGLFYTTFSANAAMYRRSGNGTTFDIGALTSAPHADYEFITQVPFFNFTATISNTGSMTSDWSGMLFASTQNAGPAPYPNKWLVGFDRLGSIAPHSSATLNIPVSLGAMARYDESGQSILYPGTYKLALNNEESVVMSVTLTGEPAVLQFWPRDVQQIDGVLQAPTPLDANE